MELRLGDLIERSLSGDVHAQKALHEQFAPTIQPVTIRSDVCKQRYAPPRVETMRFSLLLLLIGLDSSVWLPCASSTAGVLRLTG